VEADAPKPSLNYVEEPVDIILDNIRAIFERKKYPRTVRLNIARSGGTDTWVKYLVEMKNKDRWVRYELSVEAFPPTTEIYADYQVKIGVDLVRTNDLYVRKRDIKLTEKQFTTRKSLTGYTIQNEFRTILRFWQSLVQMSWVDVSLFELLRHRTARLLRKLGMD